MHKDYRRDKPLGYQRITVLSASAGFSNVPDGAELVIVTAETQAVRWRDDGTPPTATIGYPLPLNAELQYSGGKAAIEALRFIEQAASATLHACFYGQGSMAS